MDFGDRLVRFVDPRRFGALDVAPRTWHNTRCSPNSAPNRSNRASTAPSCTACRDVARWP
jgi:hypothetical protein